MYQYSDFSRDTQTSKPLPGSYEWWYFDAMTQNGYSIVVIFYEGNPFSKRYIKALEEGDSENATAGLYPAISISIYKNGKHIFYGFEEVDPKKARFSDVSPDVMIGNNIMKGEVANGNIIYTLALDQELPSGDRLAGNLEFVSGENTSGIFGKDTTVAHSESTARHEWNLLQPKAQVTGQLEITGYHREKIEFLGTGYHDHNLGREPMKDSFEEWYWGRYHFNNSTLIYYLMKQKGMWIKKAWLIKPDLEIREINDISLERHGLNIFGLNTARVIRFTGHNLEILLQKDRVIDSGPFYQRFSGRAIHTDSQGVREARGISEYIRPGRIYNRLFWPLVDMRIKYPGKAHWVQKSPVFYRWTW
jgi:carotenoid 1,2-hydratase